MGTRQLNLMSGKGKKQSLVNSLNTIELQSLQNYSPLNIDHLPSIIFIL